MRSRFNWPQGIERQILLVAVVVWAAAAAGRAVAHGRGWMAAGWLVGAVVGAQIRRTVPVSLVAAAVLAGSISGIGSAVREAETLTGLDPGTSVATSVHVSREGQPGRWGGSQVLVASEAGPRLLLRGDSSQMLAGQRWHIEGIVEGPPGRWRGEAHAGVVEVHQAELEDSGGWVAVGANLIRRRVAATFAPYDSAGGLVAGFLIGDTARVSPGDLSAMRAAGLSHFVAVSGSNVALFLGLWWVATSVAGSGPIRRALLGMVGLLLFVWVTRWEPSVVRAAVMAGLVLVSKALGAPLTGWAALGLAVTGIVSISGELVESIGFQLSVAATAGVMVAHRAIRWPVVGPLLSATLGAQAAVAPLLLGHFGSMPLVSPISNLLAVPLVTGATLLGAMAAISQWHLLAAGSAWLGAGVLRIAHVASWFPDVGAVALLGMVLAFLSWRWAPVRLLSIGGLAVWLLYAAVMPPPVRSGMVVLDVGQGDAILLFGDEGGVVLVDGGPDPSVLLDKLRHYRVRRIDLVVNTHPHHDHVAGLVAALERMPVGELWHSGHPSGSAGELLDVAASTGVAALTPEPGATADIAGVRLRVVGPLRRYVSPNDQSIVLIAETGGATFGLVGDIETHAQADIGPLAVDVLKVPHQGAATSDEDWLSRSAGGLSIISVGPNSYGHPDPQVIAVLEEAGSRVVRTDEVGDVVVESGKP